MANISFFIAYYEGRRWLLYPGYIFLSMAVLAKGPVALVLTALGWLIFTWFGKQHLLSVLRFFRLHWGLLILLLVAAPWFIAVHLETDGAFTQSFFLDHNVNRFTDTKEGHGGIPLLAVPIIFLVMLPSGLLLPRVLWNVLRYRENTILIFLLSMGIAPVIFFSFSMTVLPNYVMPGVPFLVMAISVWLYFHLKQISLCWEWVAFIIIAVAIPTGSYIGISSDKDLQGLEMLALWLIILPLTAVFGYLKYRQDRRTGLLICAAGTIVTFILICTVLLPNVDRRNPVIQSENIWRSPIEKRYYKRINPSYVFYLPDPVKPVDRLSDELPLPVLIFSRSDFSDSLRNSGYEEIFRYRNLFEKGETVIFSTPGIYDSEEVANLRTFAQPE
jgi:4-amino-4-deoxy-L-arabinose transferase-like glycosyltransferase